MQTAMSILRMRKSLRRGTWRLGRKLYCAARGEPASDEITRNGETYIQRCVVAEALRQGQLCVLDVGANKGDWSLPLLHVLPSELQTPERTKLHLIEPVPATRRELMGRLARSRLSSVATCHPWALSDKSGVARMTIVEETGGRNSLIAPDDNACESIEVETVTMAEAFERLGIARDNLVKIDAEGHDAAILSGARKLLVAGRIDVVQFEYNHTWVHARAFLKDIFDLVAGLPYEAARIRPRRIEILDAWHPELERYFHANYLLVHSGALSWFDVHRGRFDESNTYA